MDNGAAKVLSTGKTEGREGIVFGRQQELLYRTIAINPMVQSFADRLADLPDRILVQQKQYLDVFFSAVITMSFKKFAIGVKTFWQVPVFQGSGMIQCPRLTF
jgi:hypothetical protein